MSLEKDDNPTPTDLPDAADQTHEAKPPKRKSASRSSRFFVRGLATLLPAVLTLWLLVFAYGFVRDKIANPINSGIKTSIIAFTDWPAPTDEDFTEVWQDLNANDKESWDIEREALRSDIRRTNPTLSTAVVEAQLRLARLNWMKDRPEMIVYARRYKLDKQWDSIAIGSWHVLDLIGLIVAIILFYFAGVIMSNVIGRQLKDRGEKIIDRVPLIRRVYPAVKQVTDFFFGDSEEKLKFNRVIAVEYPRKGIYSVGLVTGDTMQTIENIMGEPCLTVFIPSSPTPFTGYVITVPVADTVDLGISIEDALKFAVSGGVLVPPSQVINRGTPGITDQSSNGQAQLGQTTTADPTPPNSDQTASGVTDSKTY